MTAPTPEQMRALADEPMMYNEAGVKFRGRSGKPIDELRAALRAAADKLDAVQVWVDEHHHHFQEISELDAILTADTAPQDNRDD